MRGVLRARLGCLGNKKWFFSVHKQPFNAALYAAVWTLRYNVGVWKILR